MVHLDGERLLACLCPTLGCKVFYYFWADNRAPRLAHKTDAVLAGSVLYDVHYKQAGQRVTYVHLSHQLGVQVKLVRVHIRQRRK